MYEEFYGLTRRPFENTPDPEFFFATRQHREALATLIYGINESKGFMLLTGDVGVGKTFVLQSLKHELEDQDHIILEVVTPWITPEELFAELPDKLGMDMDPEWGSLVFQSKLKERMEFLHRQGKRVLVILDEAQQLPERTLEGIRLLSNFETKSAKLVQIIFAGQNELNDVLARYSMRQIRQRITLSRSLGNLNELETRQYVEHRLKVSGAKGALFTDASQALIYKASQGAPRLVNLICDNCLITGYAQSLASIDSDVVRDVITDLPVHSSSLESGGVSENGGSGGVANRTEDDGNGDGRSHVRARKPTRGRGLYFALAVVVALILGGGYWYKSEKGFMLPREQASAYAPPSGQILPLPEEADPGMPESDTKPLTVAAPEPATIRQTVTEVDEQPLIKTPPEVPAITAQVVLVPPSDDVPDTRNVPEYKGLPVSLPLPESSAMMPQLAFVNGPATPDIKLLSRSQVPVTASYLPVFGPNDKTRAYELLLNLRFPFELLSRELKPSVTVTRGETLSQLARDKYGTWNDTVQDIVRTLNPVVGRRMDYVRSKGRISLPDIKKEYLLSEAEDKSVYVYAGTLTSRKKALDFIKSIQDVGVTGGIVTTRNQERNIYRIFIGPYVSKNEARRLVNNIDLRHMPFLN
ncbi:MAG: AAA family ATPase [Pontibacterium sp.]